MTADYVTRNLTRAARKSVILANFFAKFVCDSRTRV
jgi:hypothetical protein